MNEQQNPNTNSSPKPKKKRSFWWLKLLLILILFAAGVIAGIMLSYQDITNQIIDEFFPQYSNIVEAPRPMETVSPSEKPIEFKPAVTSTPAPSPKPSKAPVEIVSPEAEEKKADEKAETAPLESKAPDTKPVFEPVEASPLPERPPMDEAQTPMIVSGGDYIGIDAALEAALDHANLSSEEVFVYSVHRERDDGLVFYNVEFGYEGKEYEYEINAYSGKVESFQLERAELEERIAEASGNELDMSSFVSADEAKTAALEHAGYSEYTVKDVKTSLEIENNKLIYDIEFRAEGYEYDYKVDASTGNVVMLEKERS